MKTKNFKKIFLFSFGIILLFLGNSAFAQIQNPHRFAWGEDIGWINMNPISGQVLVDDDNISGYAWSHSYGWINLNPVNSGITNTSEDHNVLGCIGNLSGQAWNSHLGWIDFENVYIDEDGFFRGFATGSLSGDISFQGTNYSTRTTWQPNCNTGSVDPSPAINLISADTGYSTSDFNTKTKNPTFELTCHKKGSTLKLFKDSTEIETLECLTVGTKQITLSSALTDGEYDFNYSETDKYGNVSTLSPILDLKIDSTLPDISINPSTKIQNSAITNVSLNITDLNGINSSYLNLNDSSANYSNLNCSPFETLTNSLNCTLDITTSGDLVVKIVDIAGNEKIARENNFVIDNIPPQTPKIRVNTIAPRSIDNPEITFSAEDNHEIDHCRISYTGLGGNTETVNPATSPMILNLDPNEDIHPVTVECFDKATNSSSNTARFAPNIDINISSGNTLSNADITDVQILISSVDGNNLEDISTTPIMGGLSCTGGEGETSAPYSSPVICTGITISETLDLIVSARDVETGSVGQNSQAFVIDRVKPVIKLIGDEIISHEAKTAFTDLGATCSDNYDSICEVENSGNVDTNTLGTYIITYSARDEAGNNADVVTRTVNVVDTISPILTLNGDFEITHEVGTTFIDLGATWTDNYDSGGNVTASPSLDTSKLGEYILNYSVSDSSGNVSNSVTRKVTIVDTVHPEITINGDSPIIVSKGINYLDEGATCSDNYNTNCEIFVINKVNTNVLGNYEVIYYATDSSGNTTVVHRNVSVQSGEPPVVTLIGNQEITHPVKTIYTDAGATANDFEEGDVTDRITTTGFVNYNILGEYVLVYQVVDSAGNESGNFRKVNVVDTVKPIVTLNGDEDIILEVNTDFVDEGAICSDNYDTECIVTKTSDLDLTELGNYTINYSAKDSSNNEAIVVVRNVEVVDTTSPIITLNGEAKEKVEVHSNFVDKGATCRDNYDTNCVVTNVSTLNIAKLGEYTIEYSAIDSSDNEAVKVIRELEVVDTTAPVITNPNDTSINIWRGGKLELGQVTCRDNYDTVCDVQIIGTVDVNVLGNQSIRYKATDSSGNTSESIINVNVSQAGGSGGGGGNYSANRGTTGSSSSSSGSNSSNNSSQNSVNISESSGSNVHRPVDTTENSVNSETSNSSENVESGKTSNNSSESEKVVIVTEKPKIGKETENGNKYTISENYENCSVVNLLKNEKLNITSVFHDSRNSQYADIINKFGSLKIVSGNADGNFEGNRSITRAEFAKIVLNSHCYDYKNSNTENIKFSDIEKDSWQAKVAEKSYEIGIINGYEDGTFRPNDQITKIEATKILMKMANLQSNDLDKLNYYDLGIDWQAKYVQLGQTLGIFVPNDDYNTFRPNSPVNREEMLNMIYQTIKLY